MRSLGLPRTSVQHQFTFTASRLIRVLIPMMGLEAASDNVFMSGEHVWPPSLLSIWIGDPRSMA